MREVIKYNKNYLTGEVVHEVVHKKPQLMRNTAKIELRDAATGALIEEAFTENAVTEKYEAKAYQTIYNALLNATAGKSIGNRVSANGDVSHMFYNILLTDSDTADLEDEYFAHGNLIAAASVTGSASSTAKKSGTFNAAESFSEITDDYLIHVHRVYDWATNSGNGKIRSIYWPFASINFNNIVESTTDYDFSYSTCATGLIRASSNSQTFPYGNTTKSVDAIYFDKHGNTYINDEGVYYKCLNQKKFLLAGQNPIFETTPSFFKKIDVGGYYYNVTFKDDNSRTEDYEKIMTVHKYDYAGNEIDSWDVDCVSDCPFLVDLRNNSQLATTTGSDVFMGYTDSDGWIGIQLYFYSGSSNRYIFPAVNSDDVITSNNSYSNVKLYGFYNVITKQWLYTLDPSKYASRNNSSFTSAIFIRKVDGYNITVGNNYKMKLANGKVEFRYLWQNTSAAGYGSGTSSSSYTYNYFRRMHSEMNVGIGISQGNNYIIKLRPMGAHTRLANAIVKNSMTTMKIQYDFYFRIPADGVEVQDIWCGYEDE